MVFEDGSRSIAYQVFLLFTFEKKMWISSLLGIRESLSQFENQIMALVFVRSITRSTMYQKAPFC